MQSDIVRDPHDRPVLSTDLAFISGLIPFSESASYLDGQYQPVSNMRSAVEELSRNLTISLLSSSTLEIDRTPRRVVFWRSSGRSVCMIDGLCGCRMAWP